MGSRFAVRGRLIVDGRVVPGAVVVEGGSITEVHRGEVAAGSLPGDVVSASVVAPGFIDLQVNGGFGFEAGGDARSLLGLAGALPRTGVTAWLPTIVSSEPEVYPRAFAAFAAARTAPAPGLHAAPLGLHLEGPYLSPERKGAHRVAAIEGAPDALLETWLEEKDVKVVTLAPERPGAMERIRRLRERGIIVSLGHTNATYDQFRAGIAEGATLVTHLFSAMSSFHHRTPGAAGAALVDERVSVGLIVDGIHCHPASVRLALKAKGVERTFLVSDMIVGAGLGPGDYGLGGQHVHVDGSSARLDDGTLAGSVLTMDEAVRKTVNLAEATIAEACRMASEVPARVLGLSRTKGRLAKGCDADLVLLDENLRVQATYVGGQRAYAAAAAVAG
jgi:N-acetylglucosamine-6-phosphate deacetylase